MNLRKTLIALALFAAFFVGAKSASASGLGTNIEMTQVLEERVNRIVKAYDAKALVFVKIKAELNKKAHLPGTPFVSDLSPSAESQNLEVLILSARKPFSKDVIAVVGDMLKASGAKATFKIEGLPDDLVLAQQPSLPAAVPTPAAAPVVQDDHAKAEAEAQRREIASLKKQKDAEHEQGQGFQGSLEEAAKTFHLIAVALIGIGGGLLLLGFFMVMLGRRGSQNVALAIDSSSKQLATALADSGAGGVAQPLPQSIVTSGNGFQNAGTESESATLENYPDDALSAALSDCYWSEQDGYAAFLWKRIPPDKRQNVLARAPILADYVSALAGVQEADLGAIEEPYYLSPLPISHLNNEAIADQVRSQSGLFHKLPSLRIRALPLSAREGITLRQSESHGAFDPAGLEGLPHSMSRTLKRKIPVQIHSLEEERELLAMADLTEDLKAEIPTLGWLARLSGEEIENALSRFSARDLASCWIGPEEVLSALEEHLPPKKRQALQSYKSEVSPSRESPAFQSLHAQSLAERAMGREAA